MNWEIYEGVQYNSQARLKPRVTLSVNAFYLNRAAYEALDSPAAVEMMFELRRRVVGLKPINPTKENAFALKTHDKSVRLYRISAAGFCRKYRIKFDQTMLFEEIYIDKGVMVLDLQKTVEAGRGAR